MGPYIVNGHFMYGNTFCMPRPPYYNTICHHRAPGFRHIPPQRLIADDASDGVGYAEPEGFDSEGDCTNVVRYSNMPNITCITAKKVSTLRIKLWGLTDSEDQVFDLEIGKRYGITYLVPGGFASADGYLEYIDESISDDCTKYTGNYTEDVLQSYIGLDCSTTGKSDKRKIYIASIRSIQELEADDLYTAPEADTGSLSTDQRLDKIISMLEEGLVFVDDVIGMEDIEEPERLTANTKLDILLGRYLDEDWLFGGIRRDPIHDHDTGLVIEPIPDVDPGETVEPGPMIPNHKPTPPLPPMPEYRPPHPGPGAPPPPPGPKVESLGAGWSFIEVAPPELEPGDPGYRPPRPEPGPEDGEIGPGPVVDPGFSVPPAPSEPPLPEVELGPEPIDHQFGRPHPGPGAPPPPPGPRPSAVFDMRYSEMVYHKIEDQLRKIIDNVRGTALYLNIRVNERNNRDIVDALFSVDLDARFSTLLYRLMKYDNNMTVIYTNDDLYHLAEKHRIALTNMIALILLYLNALDR